MENIKIDKAIDLATLERCLKIRNNVFTLERGVPTEIEVDSYDCLNHACIHFLVRYCENDIGAVRCLLTADGNIQVQRFCIIKEYRELGFGQTVMEYIEAYYGNQGIKRIELDAKYEVAEFYEKCGYVKVSDVFIEANIEHVKMMKLL